jgi:hypothetical protein
MQPPTSTAHEAEAGGSTMVRAIVAALTLVAVIFVAVGYALWFQPERPLIGTEARSDYDREAMREAMSVNSLDQRVRDILDRGDRYPGRPGHAVTPKLLGERFEASGLRVLEIPFQAVAPTTSDLRLLDQRGEPLGVEVWPFLPNQMQPMVTPDQGITGELAVISQEYLESAKTFDGRIAVVDGSNLPLLQQYNWSAYARLGFEAVIVTHAQGLDRIDWHQAPIGGMIDGVPINFVRLMAEPAILDRDGQSATIHVTTRYSDVPAPTVAGLLVAGQDSEAPQGSDQLLVVYAPYDAASLVPDRSPGVLRAVNLAILEQAVGPLAEQRANLQRDVLFVATGAGAVGSQGLQRLLAAIGPRGEAAASLDKIQGHIDHHTDRLDAVRQILEVMEDESFLRDVDATQGGIDTLPREVSDFFAQQVRHTVNEKLIEFNEVLLEARLAFLRIWEDPQEKSIFEQYRTTKNDYERIMSVAGFKPIQIVERFETDERLTSKLDLRALFHERMRTLLEHHATGKQQAERERKISELVSRYATVSILTPHAAPLPTPSDSDRTDLTYSSGQEARYGGALIDVTRNLGPAFSELFRRSVQDVEGESTQTRYQFIPHSRQHHRVVGQMQGQAPLGVGIWNVFGYPAAALIHADRRDAYAAVASPVNNWHEEASASVSPHARVFGETLLSMAYGAGSLPAGRTPSPTDFTGTVYAAALGGSIVPTHPLAGALVFESPFANRFLHDGHFAFPLTRTDPYGRYSFENTPVGVININGTHQGWSPLALRHRANGLVGHVSDEGESGQSTYRSLNLSVTGKNVVGNIVTFRASPLALVDVINPQKLATFASIKAVDRESLAPLRSFLYLPGAISDNDTAVVFVPPDQRVFILFQAGSAENELVQTIRAFTLNVLDRDNIERFADSTREVDGPGFLAADHDIIERIPERLASSMKWVNDRRLELQQKYHLADDRTEAFQERSSELLEAARQPELTKLDAKLLQQSATVYQILNHPVLRKTIREAVLSILWYLALLVPFAFFFEKLAFGMADVRKQLLVATSIFIVAFVLLRLLHPAFEMVQSTLMILLGFVIMLISLGVLVLFAGKFGENLDEIRAARGVVSEADVNKLGVVGTAFMLGLNNMHRRKVRTGLTCATLVLITFAMIAFTSVQNDLVEKQVALGEAPYQGFLVKNEDLQPISQSQVDAIRSKYGRNYNVAERKMVVGQIDWFKNMLIPSFTLRSPESGRRVELKSALVFTENEPLRDQFDYLTTTRWFGDLAANDTDAVDAMILPEAAATRLGITPRMVDEQEVTLTLNGREYRVTSIVEDVSVGRVRGLDLNDLLPFDIEAMTQPPQVAGAVLAIEPYVRLQPENLVIVSDLRGVPLGDGELRTTSVAVELIDSEGVPLPYKPASDKINEYLEQTGAPAYYGLDDVAYAGERSRQQQLSGLVDMLIPLIIAALTVLNTMRGSVYERRDEIYVYNAVGIAPRYVFFMFFAEALVYSVVGSVLGYLLSQGTGRILTELELTGGLNMTFASLSTVLASLAITGAVFISTLFPALSAMRIASPAEEAGWTLPEAEGDEMAMQLPFTFDRRDRMAVLEFLTRIFLDHGEGASGAFFAGPPDLGMRRSGGDAEALPVLGVTVWLKPQDLGVSQRLEVSMPVDPESGEYIAELKLTRLSGTRESWLRLNKAFLSNLRRHFLHWRAMGEPQRASMFDDARERMYNQIAVTGETLG